MLQDLCGSPQKSCDEKCKATFPSRRVRIVSCSSNCSVDGFNASPREIENDEKINFLDSEDLGGKFNHSNLQAGSPSKGH
jgi:hypothetical protein